MILLEFDILHIDVVLDVYWFEIELGLHDSLFFLSSDDMTYTFHDNFIRKRNRLLSDTFSAYFTIFTILFSFRHYVRQIKTSLCAKKSKCNWRRMVIQATSFTFVTHYRFYYIKSVMKFQISNKNKCISKIFSGNVDIKLQ